MIRFFDLLFSVIGIIVLLPVLFLVGFLILLTSRGGVFFIQERVGKNEKLFNLVKFRSMRVCPDNYSLITVGDDSRITPIGRVIRKLKIDELPQLINVLKGEMSIVGPRPEVKKYVDLYSISQKKVLSIKPGITDYASIAFYDENEILGKALDPEDMYVKVILIKKIELNMIYVNNYSLKEYFRIIYLTILKVITQ